MGTRNILRFDQQGGRMPQPLLRIFTTIFKIDQKCVHSMFSLTTEYTCVQEEVFGALLSLNYLGKIIPPSFSAKIISLNWLCGGELEGVLNLLPVTEPWAGYSGWVGFKELVSRHSPERDLCSVFLLENLVVQRIEVRGLSSLPSPRH